MSVIEIPAEMRGRLTCSVSEVAKLYGIGRNAAYAAVRAGEIPSLRIGGRIVIPIARALEQLGVREESP